MIFIGTAIYGFVAYGLAAPIATSLVGGGPAVIIWGLSLTPSNIAQIRFDAV